MTLTAPNDTSTQPVVFAVRHGLATHKLNGYGSDVLTAELLPEGKQAVEDLASYVASLQPTQLWVSPLKRCQQTAKVIAEKTGLTMIEKEIVVEYVDGLGETREHFIARMDQLAKQIRELPSTERLCICTHGAVIAALSHVLTNREFTPFDLCDYPNPAGMRIITVDDIQQKNFQSYA